MDVRFEPLTAEHAGAVLGIFNHYVAHSFAAYPESPLPPPAFAMFQQLTSGYPAYVMKDDAGTVLGFCFLRAYQPMSTFRETAEVTYFLAPDAVGRGLGTAALARLEDDGRQRGIRHLLASVSSRNEGSLRFHRRHGFRECGRFAGVGRKQGETFDVVYLQKDL
jgi:phosphinothricin acetyltransferase